MLQAYLLIRLKRGETQQKRLEKLLQSPVFSLRHDKDSLEQVSQIRDTGSNVRTLCIVLLT